MIGVDYGVRSGNMSFVPVPKFNNKVLNPEMFDSSTNIEVPVSVLDETGSVPERGTLAQFSYVMYRTLGDVMPKSYDSSIL